MKKNKNKMLAGVLLLSVFCCGCKIGKTEVVLHEEKEDPREVFQIGEESCDLTEAKVYLANYQNIYGKSYGIDLWEQNFQQEKLKKYIKDIALSELTQVVCMDLLAQNQGVTLSEEEKKDVDKAAEQYYTSLSPAEIAYMEVEEEDIAKMYEDYVLAQKVYTSLTESIDEEVSDDEARIMEAMQIYTQQKSVADEVAAKLQTGEDFAAVAAAYSDASEIEIAFGRGEMPAKVEEAAFELENEEISDCVETEDGYYFIKCINKFNAELTDANKFNIIEAREKAAFDDAYGTFVDSLSSSLNDTVWEQIDLITDGSIQTESFFETIESKL
ncbi:MAG: peptidylprolyl isomerase [Lachnospiraceae bacterium]|nr:peptidylprolyl isomerase [Lachnospiraceae bacterium]